MKKRNLKQVFLPLLTAFIWGSSFVAQSLSVGHLGAFTFNMARSFAAVAALGLMLLILRLKNGDTRSAEEKRTERKDLLIGGICCGVFLTIGSNLQQLGIEQTAAGKAGFITALYVVLVPLFGLFFRKRVAPQVWASVVIAVVGLYYLCMDGTSGFSFNGGDFYVLLCAFAFTGQILCVDHFVQKVDGIKLSCVQFIVMTVLSAIVALVRGEPVSIGAITECLPYILYVGVLSGGVAYTLQILAQKDGDPTVVSLLLSLESFFAVVSGAIILHERLSGREYLGCALMLAAVFLSQLPEKRAKSVENKDVA